MGNEGLWPARNGMGFDGNGNGNTSDSGPAGGIPTQITPGISGDVPAFSSYVGVADGTLGGVGWRPGSLHLLLLATDTGSVSPFDSALGIPPTITGANTGIA